jgi:hypothetical protein
LQGCNSVRANPIRPPARTPSGRNLYGAGNLFGLAVKPGADAVYFVDDFSANNNLQLFF